MISLELMLELYPPSWCGATLLDDRPGEVADEVPNPMKEIGEGMVEAEAEEDAGGDERGENGPCVDEELIVGRLVVVVAHGGEKVKGKREKVKLLRRAAFGNERKGNAKGKAKRRRA
jgi:hypothetical protein